MFDFLTIDFDFFNDYPLEIRDNFPPVSEGHVGSVPDNSLWKHCNDGDFIHKTDEKFSVDMYDQLIEAIQRRYDAGLNFDHVFLSENHGYAFRALETCLLGRPNPYPFSVYNVDFHHDYSFCGNDLRCDNWARLMNDKYPETPIYWCKRDDSVTTSFGEKVPVKVVGFQRILKLIRMSRNLYIHICRSDLYSPPAFDWAFEELCTLICRNSCKVHQYEPIERERERMFDDSDRWFVPHD